MIDVAPATEAEMIAAFLAAEIDASRYGAMIRGILQNYGAPRRVIDAPNLADENENQFRRVVLMHYRGYPNNMLFAGFPADVTWRRVRLKAEDFQRMRCAAEPGTLVPLAPTRLVTEAARNFTAGVPAAAGMAHVAELVADLKRGAVFYPIIAAQDHDGSLILIEGHSRAMAYVIVGLTDAGYEALVGTAPSFDEWRYY